LNAYRPETQTVEKAIEYIREIESIAQAKVTGIVNNTHMLKNTTVEDVLYGQKLAEKVHLKLMSQIKYIVAIENVAMELPSDLNGEIFPIKLNMRADWMM